MIKQLNLQNFQSHKLTTLDFEPGVNIIVGESDTGKSAIIRALRLLIHNRPSGDSFRSEWAMGEEKKPTIVSAFLSGNGEQVVSRVKSDKENQYVIEHPTDPSNNDRLVFNAIKTEVPDEIVKTLNMETVNLQMQGDSHFLISNTSGEVAQHFNRIANLSKIDSSLQNIEKWYRQVKQDLANDEKQLEEKEQELQEYDYLDNFESEVESLEQMQNEYTQVQAGIKELKKVISTIDEIKEQVEEYDELIKAEKKVNQVVSLIQEKESTEEDYAKLSRLCTDIEVTQAKIEENDEIIEAEEDVDEIIKLVNERKELKNQYLALNTKLEAALEVQEESEENKKLLNDLEIKFHENIGRICPLCDQEIKKK